MVKEIEETKDMPYKVLDLEALHRNDQTHEVEGHDIIAKDGSCAQGGAWAAAPATNESLNKKNTAIESSIQQNGKRASKLQASRILKLPQRVTSTSTVC